MQGKGTEDWATWRFGDLAARWRRDARGAAAGAVEPARQRYSFTAPVIADT